MTELSFLVPFLIKYVVISNYEPTEDAIEVGINVLSNPIKSLLKKHSESINVKLVNIGFTSEQIKCIKQILAESDTRFITNSAGSIYEHKADAMVISRRIFETYIKKQDYNNGMENEPQVEVIIKGISFIVQEAINVCLLSPEYPIYLTKILSETETTTKKNYQQLQEFKDRITNLENVENQKQNNLIHRVEEYQKYIMHLYTRQNTGNDLLGEESLSELYLQPRCYFSSGYYKSVDLLLEEFVLDKNSKGYGVLWIVGEPGHGKTSMCIKAIADHIKNIRYKSVNGVFWFRLNPQNISTMVEYQSLKLRLAFSWERIEGDRSETFDPAELNNCLVFLDGFDELKSTLNKYNVSNEQFYKQVNQIAEEYRLYIVVTSRTCALVQKSDNDEKLLKNGSFTVSCSYRDGSKRINEVRLLAPLTSRQQTQWLTSVIEFRNAKNIDTSRLEKYQSTFYSLQNNKEISGLLEIPILLRMIVQNCFTPLSNNRVTLYADLFNSTLDRQGLERQRKSLRTVYQKLAYKIFVYDDDSAEISENEIYGMSTSNAYLYQYYLQIPKLGKSRKTNYYCVSFLHRSFYQYFLSEYLSEQFQKVNSVQSGIDFIKLLWARRLDSYVLNNLSLTQTNYEGFHWILEGIDSTDCIFSDNMCEEESRNIISNYDKANNVFWNSVSIINTSLSGMTLKTVKPSNHFVELLAKYDCSELNLNCFTLNSISLKAVDLSYSQLSQTNIRDSDLSFAHLNSAKLVKADLGSANLCNTDLSHTDLRFADMSYANLSYSNLSFANMSYVNLSVGKLIRANLESATLSSADLSNADLSFAYLTSAKFYKAILINTNLAYADLTYVNSVSADFNNASLRFADLSWANLRHAKFIHADLSSACLTSSNLSDADLNNAVLVHAILKDADLSFVNLSHANISYADMSLARLSSSNLEMADLSAANLSNADLSDVDLTRTILRDTVLTGANVRNAKVTQEQYRNFLLKYHVRNIKTVIITSGSNELASD